MFLGNNPIVDGLHCTLVESVKERAFLSVSRRHMVWFVTQDHSTGETKNLSMDGVYRVYHGNSFGFSLMLGNNGALSDWWQIIYSLSIFLFLLPILLQYLLPSFFLLWSEKKKHCTAQLPDAAHLSTASNHFTHLLNQSLEWELPSNYTGILNLQGAQIYQK